MKEWYFGNIVYKQEEYDYKISEDNSKETNYIEKERVLALRLDNNMYKVYSLNEIESREYSLVETGIILTNSLDKEISFVDEEKNYKSLMYPSAIRNLELVEVGELVPIIISHLGLYLKYQNESGIYARDVDIEEIEKKLKK